jgi:hypothetical protein
VELASWGCLAPLSDRRQRWRMAANPEGRAFVPGTGAAWRGHVARLTPQWRTIGAFPTVEPRPPAPR